MIFQPSVRRTASRAGTILGPLFLFVTLASVAGAQETKPVPPDHAQRMKEGMALFTQHVRPVLIQQCLECHGGKATKGDFNMVTRESLMASGMVGDDAESSHMYDVVTHSEKPHMPFERPKLNDETLVWIKHWLDLGAPYDKPLVGPPKEAGAPVPAAEPNRSFWSMQPLAVTAPPAVRPSDWVRTPIDRFILAALEAQGLHPNPPADRRTLIRRAYADLLGRPPTPEDVQAFQNDADPQAYERLIDRLLESPQYGERWARHWLDVARFAESHGYEQDYDRPYAFHYRDFLIRAFNADMPCDQFIAWQIAGDELAPDDPLAMMATGFLGAGAFPTQLTEAEFESARYDELDDMVQVVGSAVLGLSIGCARCHDHKYDPITTRDYYRMAANFTKTIRSEIDLSVEAGQPPVKVQVTSEGFPHTKHHADDRGFPHFYPETYFLVRGDVKQKKGVAPPGFLPVLMAPGKTEADWKVTPPAGWTRTSFQRAALAHWLTDPQDGAGGLAARVMVNRIWQHHFGRGIVATPNDFGFQGERPTHPELLDWLATDLIHNGWRVKRLQKLIMTSAVYMQNGAYDEARAAVDRENRLLWRRDPRRLEAEAIRDSMLAVSGLLDNTMYGPGTLDLNMRRRSVYFFIKRSKLIPMMMLFDWPEHLVSIGQRSQTTIAPQALMFLNSPQTRQWADGFAQRVEEAPAGERMSRAFWMALGRGPTNIEAERAGRFIEQQAHSYQADGKPRPEHLAWTDLCQTLFSMNEFIYVD